MCVYIYIYIYIYIYASRFQSGVLRNEKFSCSYMRHGYGYFFEVETEFYVILNLIKKLTIQ